MAPDRSYYQEGGREGESSARIINRTKKKSATVAHAFNAVQQLPMH